MKITQFPSSVLSLCLIVITQSGCQHHHDGAGDIITKVGNGVSSANPVGNNALKGNSTLSSGNCDVMGTAAAALNSQGVISGLQLGQIGLGVEQTKTTQIIATYTVTDSSQNQKHFFASLIFDQNACVVSMFSIGELVGKVPATSACDYSGKANDADLLLPNPNTSSTYQVTETLLSNYSTSDPKAPPQVSNYSAIYSRTIVELYRVFQSASPAKQYGVLFVIDKDKCTALMESSNVQLLPQGNATVAPVPKGTTPQNQNLQKNQKNHKRIG